MIQNDFQNQLNKLKLNFDEGINSLANQIRNELIIPLCQKHKMSYVSRKGHYDFIPDGDPSPSYSEEEMYSLLDILDMSIGDYKLGFLIPSYKYNQ